MGEVWFTSDLHLQHSNIIALEKDTRPFSSIEEHDEALINNYNSVVRNRDTVWILGDVFFGKDGFGKASRLKGIKNLILGNHDSYSAERYFPCFNKIYGSFKFKKLFMLTHFPLAHDYLDRFRVNLHGHIHRRDYKYPCDNGILYYNVGVDHNDLMPVAFNVIREKFKEAIE
jgi:calcineurin-like phosphoesterase family protein